MARVTHRYPEKRRHTRGHDRLAGADCALQVLSAPRALHSRTIVRVPVNGVTSGRVVPGRVMARDRRAFTARCEPGIAHSTVVNRPWQTRPLANAQVRILGRPRVSGPLFETEPSACSSALG